MVFAAMACCVAYLMFPSPGYGGWAGRAAPAFQAADLDGVQVSLPELLGKSTAVVVNFWGLRCQSCLEEMPYLAALADKFGTRGVRVIGVNADGAAKEKIREMLPKLGIRPSYTLLCDQEFKVMDAFGVTATPLTLLVRPDGVVAYEHLGFGEGDEKKLESELLKVIGPAGN